MQLGFKEAKVSLFQFPRMFKQSIYNTSLREKCPYTEFFLVRIFLYLDQKKNPYLDIFHALRFKEIFHQAYSLLLLLSTCKYLPLQIMFFSQTYDADIINFLDCCCRSSENIQTTVLLREVTALYTIQYPGFFFISDHEIWFRHTRSENNKTPRNKFFFFFN